MATCKDCLSYEVCINATDPNPEYTKEIEDVQETCIHFKNKADYAEAKHGEWIIDTSIKTRGFYEVNYKVLITCSICGNRHCLGEQPYPIFTQEELKTDTYRKYRYCGECGAKMDGIKEE